MRSYLTQHWSIPKSLPRWDVWGEPAPTTWKREIKALKGTAKVCK